jgi:hypothetical protein
VYLLARNAVKLGCAEEGGLGDGYPKIILKALATLRDLDGLQRAPPQPRPTRYVSNHRKPHMENELDLLGAGDALEHQVNIADFFLLTCSDFS